MKKIILRIVDDKEYDAIKAIFKDTKYIVVSLNPEEGTLQEISNQLNNSELFLIYRRLRKKYFKIRDK